MSQSLDKVLQPDGTYKWQMVEISEAHGIVPVGADGKPIIPEPAPKRTKKTKPQVEETNVEAQIEPASES
jgi:hypothetical protein